MEEFDLIKIKDWYFVRSKISFVEISGWQIRINRCQFQYANEDSLKKDLAKLVDSSFYKIKTSRLTSYIRLDRILGVLNPRNDGVEYNFVIMFSKDTFLMITADKKTIKSEHKKLLESLREHACSQIPEKQRL